MARPGVGGDRIIEVIRELDAQGKEVTVTAVRERLGSGSYSTIGAVLSEWRSEQARAIRPAVPEMPETVGHLVRHLWGEAWKAADGVHEPERQAFIRERHEHERAQGEMAAEISRLEGELDAEKERGTLTVQTLERQLQVLTEERDRSRHEVGELREQLAAAVGALGEAKGQAERDAGRLQVVETKNQELSERVIEEAAKAMALAERVQEFEGRTKK